MLHHAFGKSCFEEEERRYGDNWGELFFPHTDFVNQARDDSCYLLVGRRGSGKSSLAYHLANECRNTRSVFLSEERAAVCIDQLQTLAKSLNLSEIIVAKRLSSLWQEIIWTLLFEEFQDEVPEFKHLLPLGDEGLTRSDYAASFISKLLERFSSDNLSLARDIERFFTNDKLRDAKEKIKELLKSESVLIVIDSQEGYSLADPHEMWILAALVEAAYKMSQRGDLSGLNIKICVADEVYPYLSEEYISNTTKYIRDPLFLHWRPKHLVRFICWRYVMFLKYHRMLQINPNVVDWSDYTDVYEKVWIRYFGEFMHNKQGYRERVLPYILRHTHLRPRQLVKICNGIAVAAQQSGNFPQFDPADVIAGVSRMESLLSSEIINAYKLIYRNVSKILRTLSRRPFMFEGKTLDKIASHTASNWEQPKYSPDNFKRLLVETGIVGRVREQKPWPELQHHYSGSVGGQNWPVIYEADFEFSVKRDLYIRDTDTCVIHPMFYKRLNIDVENNKNVCVYPFPDHPEYRFKEQEQ